MANRPLAVVETPQVRPPRGATLLGSVNVITDSEARWEGGFTWRPEPCGAATVLVAGTCDAPFGGFDEDLTPQAEDFGEYLPHFVAAAQECSGINGAAELAAVEERVRRLLEWCQTKAIAAELWGGVAAKSTTPDLPNDFLGNNLTLDRLNASATTGALTAMQELEAALADCTCGGQGVIHASARVATRWSSLNLLERQTDGRLLTKLGTLVVADPGYEGLPPDTTAAVAGAEWAYGTGMVDVRLGPVQIAGMPDAFVYSTNDFLAYAFRAYSATFDPCCHVGIRVSLTTLT